MRIAKIMLKQMKDARTQPIHWKGVLGPHSRIDSGADSLGNSGDVGSVDGGFVSLTNRGKGVDIVRIDV